MVLPKLKVAVAGTSFAGDVHIPVLQSHPRTQVVAVSSGKAERAEASARQHGIPGHYTNIEEMLDKEKPDLLSIATPPAEHFPMTMAALDRGIHVLCEKPFTLNTDEARRLKSAADKSPVVAMIDFEFRFSPARMYMKQLLGENYVGEVRLADFNIHFDWRTLPEDKDWNWWSDASQGGGVLGAFGSHAVDALRNIMGTPRRLFCDLVTFVRKRKGGTVTSDDAFNMIMEFESGARASIQITQAAGMNDARFGIYGTEGQMIIPHIHMNELLGGKRSDRESAPLQIPAVFHLEPEAHPLRPPFRALLTHMVNAIDKKQPSPSPNFEDALWSQIIIDAAKDSARKGSWVAIQW
jgi:predicted dehydrogenase